uniref:Rab9A protein n=1 Tax=Dugesia japonica TaxID=6161 RepID=A0A2U8LNA1_DUGJA|nr:Rab9A protein [Dugesia japonica]
MSDCVILLKVILLGDCYVGKSSLMQRYVTNKYKEDNYHTIGVEFLRKEIVVNNQRYLLQIWDTAGQEKYRSLRTPFYRGADICVLTFSFDNVDSFDHLEVWWQEFLRYSGQENAKFPFIVFGNKCDLNMENVEEQRILDWCATHGESLKQVAEFTKQKCSSLSAKEEVKISDMTKKDSKVDQSNCTGFSWLQNGIPYLPTSAKENTNVDIGFSRAVQIWEQIHGYSDMIDVQTSDVIKLRKPSILKRACCL